MALTAKLELRQGQQLVMTPQLQQAIRLLQLSNLELGQFVETELERNPLLEMDETPDVSPKEHEPPAERSEPAGDEEWLDLGKPVADADGGLDGDSYNDWPPPPAAWMRRTRAVWTRTPAGPTCASG